MFRLVSWMWRTLGGPIAALLSIVGNIFDASDSVAWLGMQPEWVKAVVSAGLFFVAGWWGHQRFLEWRESAAAKVGAEAFEEIGDRLSRRGEERMKRLGRAVGVVRQLALNGDIELWGRKRPSDTLLRIPREFWEGHQVALESLLDPHSVGPHTERVDSSPDNDKYMDLQLPRGHIIRAVRLARSEPAYRPLFLSGR